MMKPLVKILTLLLLLIALPAGEKSEQNQSIPGTQALLIEEPASFEKLLSDKRKRQQRQNNVGRVNARNKRKLKKYGLAQVETVFIWKEASNA